MTSSLFVPHPSMYLLILVWQKPAQRLFERDTEMQTFLHLHSLPLRKQFFSCKLNVLEKISKISVLEVLETLLPSTFHIVPSQQSHLTLLQSFWKHTPPDTDRTGSARASPMFINRIPPIQLQSFLQDIMITSSPPKEAWMADGAQANELGRLRET